jgi:hypothetical protein
MRRNQGCELRFEGARGAGLRASGAVPCLTLRAANVYIENNERSDSPAKATAATRNLPSERAEGDVRLLAGIWADAGPESSQRG